MIALKNKVPVLIIIVIVGLVFSISCNSVEGNITTTTPSLLSTIPSPKIVGEWKHAGFAIGAGVVGKIKGNDYLFISTETTNQPSESGIRILDLKDPANPEEISYLKATPNPQSAGPLELFGTILYISEQDYLWIVDVSDPFAPKEISRLIPKTGFFYWIAISGKFIYIASAPEGITIADISDPKHPQIIGNFAIRPLVIHALGSLLLVLDYDHNLHILDTSSPTSLKETGIFPNPGGPPNTDTQNMVPDTSQDIASYGKNAYLTSSLSGLWVIDVSTADAITNVKIQGFVSQILISGKLVYIMDFPKISDPYAPTLIKILDISDANKPLELSSVELLGDSFGNAYKHFIEGNNYIYCVQGAIPIKIIEVY